ncbi:MAG TPA: hypothetical protein VIY27_01520, partial [Myxococcota bacterium]
DATAPVPSPEGAVRWARFASLLFVGVAIPTVCVTTAVALGGGLLGASVAYFASAVTVVLVGAGPAHISRAWVLAPLLLGPFGLLPAVALIALRTSE